MFRAKQTLRTKLIQFIMDLDRPPFVFWLGFGQRVVEENMTDFVSPILAWQSQNLDFDKYRFLNIKAKFSYHNVARN